MIDVKQLEAQLPNKPEAHWRLRGEKMALELFQNMAQRVPAYQDFLHKQGVKPQAIRTIEDFSQLPTVDKDNYLRQYPLEALCWDGVFGDGRWVISTTSGSTGEPFYFPRSDLQDEQYALTAELYLRANFQIQHRKTLYIDAFAMGAWIGGLFTYEAVHQVAQKGYALSIITPGINKAEVINSVRRLGANFDQVIIGCYPPIMRDIIDLGIEAGLNWRDYNLGIVFSAEGFSEEFRDYIADHAQLANIYTSTLNHYGTVDLGTMSHETPLSILVRRQANQNQPLFKTLFGEISKQPTLTQFLPELFYFESQDNRVICSAHSGLPLARYDLKDHGGLLALDDVVQAYESQGFDLDEQLAAAGIADTKWNLPFVYLYERSDFSVTFSGAQIYPEEIRRALLAADLHAAVSGKFTMMAGYDRRAQNYLDLHVELRQNVKPSPGLAKKVQAIVVEHLLKSNSEYRVLYGEYKSKLNPRVKLWEYGHQQHFSGQGKQRWVKQ